MNDKVSVNLNAHKRKQCVFWFSIECCASLWTPTSSRTHFAHHTVLAMWLWAPLRYECNANMYFEHNQIRIDFEHFYSNSNAKAMPRITRMQYFQYIFVHWKFEWWFHFNFQPINLKCWDVFAATNFRIPSSVWKTLEMGKLCAIFQRTGLVRHLCVKTIRSGKLYAIQLT